jgi:hypothetical protein
VRKVESLRWGGGGGLFREAMKTSRKWIDQEVKVHHPARQRAWIV